MFLSIIIPNYCHAAYLDQRIQSVLNQTYRDFELIILDDCSPDDGASRAIIEKYRNHPQVTHIVYNEKNSGSTFKQWEKGFQLAKGDYIWIAESDDFCTKDMLQELVSCIERYPDCSIIQTTSCYVDSDGNPLAPNWKPKGITTYLSGLDFIRKHLVCSNLYIPNASAVIFRKEDAMSIAKDYMNYKASGDRLFWIYMCEKGGVCTVDKQMNFFRQHQLKVSPRKETDGTQCRENYQINQYLHSKGYVRGIMHLEEYVFYWKYLHSFTFDSEETRDWLIEMWFPEWWRGFISYNISNFFVKCYEMIQKLRNRHAL